MISFELDSSQTGIEIFFDQDGIDELISYLNYIKNSNESFHLTAGNELKEEPINEHNTPLKHAKLIVTK